MTNQAVELKKPTRSFVQFFWWLKNVMDYHPDICIDVGAAGGTPSINRSFPNALHFAFEPQKQFIPALQKELLGYRHEIFEMALMSESGMGNLNVPKNAYSATMMSRASDVPVNETSEVKISTLDTEIADRIDNEKVLLKTDCQGGDLDVVKGGINTLKKCDVVIMETSLYRFWGAHHPDFYDIVSFMKTQGMVVFDILDGMFKPSNRSLGQVDLVFVHEKGELRPHHRW